MNRRGFLSSLGTITAGLVLDPERLLWVPGQKLISIPAPTKMVGEILFFSPQGIYGTEGIYFSVLSCVVSRPRMHAQLYNLATFSPDALASRAGPSSLPSL